MDAQARRTFMSGDFEAKFIVLIYSIVVITWGGLC